eukprot:6181047-Pleurochrysis_carterae.AAC.3
MCSQEERYIEMHARTRARYCLRRSTAAARLFYAPHAISRTRSCGERGLPAFIVGSLEPNAVDGAS